MASRTSDDRDLNASCLQVGRNASGEIGPIRTYVFSDNLNASYLDEYTGGVEISFTRNYSLRFNISRKFF